MNIQDLKETLKELCRQLIGTSSPEIRELERQIADLEAEEEVNNFEIESQKRILK